MSAYGFTPEQLESFQRAIKERLDRLTLHPHQRLGFPPIARGKDVDVQRLGAEPTVELFKKKAMN